MYSSNDQNLPSVTTELPNRHDILRLLRIGAHAEVVRNPPEAHLSIVTSTGEDVVVERVPIVVQHGGSMSSEQGHDIRQLSTLFQRDDGECAAARGLPVDRHVFGVTFYDVGVPCVLADAQVVVACLALAGLPEDMSWWVCSQYAIQCDPRGVDQWAGGQADLRYLDALTKRPDMDVDVGGLLYGGDKGIERCVPGCRVGGSMGNGSRVVDKMDDPGCVHVHLCFVVVGRLLNAH